MFIRVAHLYNGTLYYWSIEKNELASVFNKMHQSYKQYWAKEHERVHTV